MNIELVPIDLKIFPDGESKIRLMKNIEGKSCVVIQSTYPPTDRHLLQDIVIALDSTGIKVANRGEWIRHKWHDRKGYLKIHVAVDIKNEKIISLEVSSEVHDDGKMLKLVDHASENNNVKGVLADGMYNSNNNFRYLSNNHIKPGVKTRSNSKV